MSVPIGLIALTTYQPDGRFKPAVGGSGEGVLGLMMNTVAPREEPDRVLSVLSRDCRDAQVLAGPRGDAATAARALLVHLDGGSRGPTRVG